MRRWEGFSSGMAAGTGKWIIFPNSRRWDLSFQKFSCLSVEGHSRKIGSKKTPHSFIIDTSRFALLMACATFYFNFLLLQI